MQKSSLLVLFALLSQLAFNQVTTPQRVGTWESVSEFSISQNGDYMILSSMVLGKHQLSETWLQDGNWTEPQLIATINRSMGEGFDIGGPFLSYNDQRLYYHANFPNTKGGYDIYYSNRSADGWSEPIQLDESINSPYDEMYPSVSPGDGRLIFARTIPNHEFRKPRDTPNCQRIFISSKSANQTWGAPVHMHDMINQGCEHSPKIAIDGKTLVFASVDESNHRDGYNLYYTREIMDDDWLEPVLFESLASDQTNINPQIAGDYLYFIRQGVDRRESYSRIYRIPLPTTAKPFATYKSKGKVVTQGTEKPINANITVFDPTTLNVLGRFESNAQTGEYKLPLLNGRNYIVDVRKQGFSFASFMVDLRQDEKILGPETIILFNETQLELTVYDSETFRPLTAEVSVRDAEDENRVFRGPMSSEGIYSITLPIGNEYVVKANSFGFDYNKFNFNLKGDIIFSRFERNLSLNPIRKPFEIIISDSETDEGVAAEVLITNLNREEVIIFSAQDVKDGKVTAMLREGDQYEFTVRGAQGYSFYNQVVDLKEEEVVSLKAELVSLRAKTAIRLNNINFSTNSAELSTESFPELDRVVQLIFDNPNITIEIAAHTDNVGAAGFNRLLSERRAQSVVNYLLDNEVPMLRIVAKGYGLSQPMVPNTSEENRALNRRVEFRILDVDEESEGQDDDEA